jgi:uncharacterized protein (UPF0216 family)
MALEVKDLRDRLARRRRPLSDLLEEETPSVETQGGGTHEMDPDELERWDVALRPHERHRLRLPVTFTRSKETADSLFLEDELAADVLERMGLVSEGRAFRDGKLWLGKPLADEVLQALPTTTQLALR